MPLSYEQSDVFNVLSPLLEEYSEWYTGIVKFILYPNENQEFKLITPRLFSELVNQGNDETIFDSITLDKLKSIQSELYASATKIVEKVKGNSETKIPSGEFNEFSTMYEGFVGYVRRIEKDMITKDSGFDSKTGLRSVSMVEADMAKELERRARNGKTFSLVLAKLDNVEEIKDSGEYFYDRVIKISADSALECIRSFDDAYFISEDEFLLSLKHADIDGGIACIDRLRDILNRRKLEDEPLIQGEFTMSHCVGEPLPGYDIWDMINGMRADMKENIIDIDSTIKYIEQSPLQKFLKSVE